MSHSAKLTRRGLTAGMIASFVPRTTFDQASADAEGSAAERLGAGLVPIVQHWQQDSSHTPGVAVGVKLANGAVWNEGFGVADRDTGAPMPPDDNMRIGSVTKTFVGTVVLQLFDEGALNLDDPLSAYISGDIPPIPDSDRITLRMLGDMTSGLFDYVDVIGEPPVCNKAPTRLTPRELVEVGISRAPYFSPGQGFKYSNTNFILLGMIIENLTKRSVRENIRTRVLKPLGMHRTVFPLGCGYPGSHPEGYNVELPTLALIDNTYIEPAGAWTAGAMISTARDMLLYAKPLATGQLISERAQQERTKWQNVELYPSGRPFTDQKYGFALCDMDGSIGHGGNIPGFETFLGYLPTVDASFVIISNLEYSPDPGLGAPGLARRIADFLLANA